MECGFRRSDGADCMYDRGGYPIRLQQVCPITAVNPRPRGRWPCRCRAADRTSWRCERRRRSRRHHGGEITTLFGMVQHLLAVARAKTQDAEVTDDSGCKPCIPTSRTASLTLLA